MAKGKKYGGRDFQPGNTIGKNGRPKQSVSMKQLKKLTQSELEEVAAVIVKSDYEALETMIKDKKESTLKLWIASAAYRGIRRGDLAPLLALLNRLLGRIPQPIEIEMPTPFLIKDPDGKVITALGAKKNDE